jgi:RNA polymerase sigma factor (sigma-70 family)
MKDVTAFDTLVYHYNAFIYKQVHFYFKSSKALVEMRDLHQEALMGFEEAIRKFKESKVTHMETTPLAALAKLYIKSRVYTYCTKQMDYLNRKMPLEGESSLEIWLQDSTEGPLELLEKEETLKILEESVNLLTPRQQDIMNKRYFQNVDKVTQDDLAKEYGITYQSVSDSETRAIKRLRKILGEK